METPERREAGGRVPLRGAYGPEERERTGEPSEKNGTGEGVAVPDEIRRKLEAKDWHIRELYDELTATKLAVDEAVAKAEADELRVGNLEEERARLKERVRALEEEERGWRRWRAGQDRRVARLEREVERREAEIRHLKDLLENKDDEMEAYDREARDTISRKDAALDNAWERIEGLQRDLEEREKEVTELKDTIDELRAELDLEYERRRRTAEPANRLRAGIDLFNRSEHLQSVDSISKSLGQPEVHVVLDEEGDEPPVILTFTWEDVTWRTYAANPGLAVEEPRVYQMGAGEALSGADRQPPNAHIGPGGRVVLGL